MQVTTYRMTAARTSSKAAHIIGWFLLLAGVGLLVGAGFAVWSEVEFRRIAVETDGRVVQMLSHSSRSSSGGSSRTYTPVFAFRLPDGKEIRVEGGVSSNPPCCTVGEAVRVRYDPAQPDRAAMTGFMSSWFVATLLGGMGITFTGFGMLAMKVIRRSRMATPAGAVTSPAAMSFTLPLAGLRREQAGDGPRWILQARWTDPANGTSRLFESEPLPFDPVPQMRQMTTIQVQFDPAAPNGPYRMDTSFLVAP